MRSPWASRTGNILGRVSSRLTSPLLHSELNRNPFAGPSPVAHNPKRFANLLNTRGADEWIPQNRNVAGSCRSKNRLMKLRKSDKTLCAECRVRPALFRRWGKHKLKYDSHHNLCCRCYRSLRDVDYSQRWVRGVRNKNSGGE